MTGNRPPSCRCNSHAQHWLRANNRRILGTCSKLDCSNPAILGGHVINCHGNASNAWKITPLCARCNSIATSTCYDLKASANPILVTDTRAC